MENVARVLEVELKEMFDFMHLEPEVISSNCLERHHERASEQDKILLYRIARLMGE